MKRWIALCLSLLLLAALSACKKESEMEQKAIEQQTVDQKAEEDLGIAEIESSSKENPDTVRLSDTHACRCFRTEEIQELSGMLKKEEV